jgi:hypothetical protein
VKKLSLALSDAELDHAVADSCHKMHGKRDKPRATFLLAESYSKLSLFT